MYNIPKGMINLGFLVEVLNSWFDTFLLFFSLHFSAKRQLLYLLFNRQFLIFLS